MKRRKSKLGARILSDSEMRAILPNAESVYEQIALFRSQVPEMGESGEEYEQKTNNIGIMGCRGAGKTSILRTFHHKLTKENEKRRRDVILPIIVPENMSDGTILMDVILGMLKPVVEERENARQFEGNGECIYRGRSSLEKAYDKLVKKYCYIKKDYRDILIQQFTTEQTYVDKTKEVFNSDTEFIRQFHYFIKMLFEGAQEGNLASEGLLFFFIDDIDLSTTRCTDVVKTLLSYLSHPRIVTFISGDTKTFEEALALDFLRQEQALDAKVFERAYYSTMEAEEVSSLVERKKTLAYEYLKKIIPPAYRRTIKYWSLEERGKYEIAKEAAEDGDLRGISGEPGETIHTGQKNLAQLLTEVIAGRLERSYFIYEDQGKREFLPVAYHLFDDTSRGLNNVYNVLLEITEQQELHGEQGPYGKQELHGEQGPDGKQEAGSRLQGELWRLVETIVDAKPLFVKYKEQLFRRIVTGTEEGVKVNFQNALHWLYPEKGEYEGEQTFDPVCRFALFLWVDFVSGLFQVEKDEAYGELKNRVLEEYIREEAIEGKISAQRVEVSLALKENFQKDAQGVLGCLFRESDFLLGIYLLRYLGRETICQILEDRKGTNSRKIGNGLQNGPDRQGNGDQKKEQTESERIYKIAYGLMKAVSAMEEGAEGIKESLAALYLRMPEELNWLLDRLPLNPKVIYGERLLEMHAPGRYFWEKGPDLANIRFAAIEGSIWDCMELLPVEAAKTAMQNIVYEHEKLLYWIYFEARCREKKFTENGKPRIEFDLFRMQKSLISRGLTKTCMSRMEPVMDQYQVKKLSQGDYGPLTGEEEKEIGVIRQLDEKGLWNRQYVKEKVYPYLERKKEAAVSGMTKGRVIFDASDLLKGSYQELKDCYKGSTGTALVRRLKGNVDLFLWPRAGQRSGAGTANPGTANPNTANPGTADPGTEQTESVKGGSEQMFSNGKYYMELEQVLVLQCIIEEFLTNHPRVRYGKQEARRLLMELRELPLVLHTDDWQLVQEELRKRESELLEGFKQRMGQSVIANQKIMQCISSDVIDQGNGTLENAAGGTNGAKPGETKGGLDYETEKNRILDAENQNLTLEEKREKIKSWFKFLNGISGKLCEKMFRINEPYVQYLIQKERIDGMKKIYGISKRELEEIRQAQEMEIPVKTYLFFLHSLLRCYQENDSDAAKAGAQEEEIARLVDSLLESEVLADRWISNEIYEALRPELTLTEEEFEALF